VLGCEIPYKKLGHSSLDDFLKSIPDIAKSSVINGIMMVQAVPNKESAHILKLVQGQKKSKGKPKSFQNPSYSKSKIRPPLLLHPPSPYNTLTNPYTKKNTSTPSTVPWSTPTFSRQTVPSSRIRSAAFVPPHSTINVVNSYGVVQPPPVSSGTFKNDAPQSLTNRNAASEASSKPTLALRSESTLQLGVVNVINVINVIRSNLDW